MQEKASSSKKIFNLENQANKIGMVGGYAIGEVNRLFHAFMNGARSVKPEIQFKVTFIGSWYDPPKAKEAAFAHIRRSECAAGPAQTCF